MRKMIQREKSLLEGGLSASKLQGRKKLLLNTAMDTSLFGLSSK